MKLIFIWLLIFSFCSCSSQNDVKEPNLQEWKNDTIGTNGKRYEILHNHWGYFESFKGKNVEELTKELGTPDYICDADSINGVLSLMNQGKILYLYLFENYLYKEDYTGFKKGGSCERRFTSSYIIYVANKKGVIERLEKVMSGG